MNIEITSNVDSKTVRIIEGVTTLSYKNLDHKAYNDMGEYFITAAATLMNYTHFNNITSKIACEFLVEIPDKEDYKCVDIFSTRMKQKLTAARVKGKYGWNSQELCSTQYLEYLLEESLKKQNYVDVANYCMMLHTRNENNYDR